MNKSPNWTPIRPQKPQRSYSLSPDRIRLHLAPGPRPVASHRDHATPPSICRSWYQLRKAKPSSASSSSPKIASCRLITSSPLPPERSRRVESAPSRRVPGSFSRRRCAPIFRNRSQPEVQLCRSTSPPLHRDPPPIGDVQRLVWPPVHPSRFAARLILPSLLGLCMRSLPNSADPVAARGFRVRSFVLRIWPT